MRSVNDRELAIGRVYAEAMLDLAEPRGEIDALLKELEDLLQITETHPQFAAFLSSPTVDDDHRRDAIEKLFRGRYSDLLVDALQVIHRKGRLGLLPALVEAYRLARDERLGLIRVRVRSCAPLSEQQRETLRAVVRQRTGKDADLIEEIEAELIGGLIVYIGDEKLDTSVSRKLRLMLGKLMERASREIHDGRTYFDVLPV